MRLRRRIPANRPSRVSPQRRENSLRELRGSRMHPSWLRAPCAVNSAREKSTGRLRELRGSGMHPSWLRVPWAVNIARDGTNDHEDAKATKARREKMGIDVKAARRCGLRRRILANRPSRVSPQRRENSLRELRGSRMHPSWLRVPWAVNIPAKNGRDGFVSFVGHGCTLRGFVPVGGEHRREKWTRRLRGLGGREL